jgi:hypothetical protein
MMFQTAADLIDAKGGPAAFAKAIGSDPGAVRMMKHRNKLPRTVWPEIVEAYQDISLSDLKAIEAQAAA